ncbi:MAG: 5-formyltetrahydrofolate cyclo-ligase, partial [Deltaproteobacteria bacterium]|nr:5-formyltetrahydrofolate cyclo-ligase [Deltaproteobacteria bacterium]
MLVKERKSMLRRTCRDLVRAKAGSDSSRLAGDRAQEHFLAGFPPRSGMAAAIYIPVRGEVETGRIREAYLAAGATLYYPCVMEGGTLEFRPHRNGDGWVEGPYGIPEPPRLPGRPARVDGFDLVLVPGVAFDRKGNRLGRGLGYYDRFLARLPGDVLRVGLAYSDQVVPEVPVDEWDVPLHALAT